MATWCIYNIDLTLLFFCFLEKTLTKYRNCLLILLLVCDNLMRLLTCILCLLLLSNIFIFFSFLVLLAFLSRFSYTTFFLSSVSYQCLPSFLSLSLQFYPKCVCVCWCICMYNGIIERKIIKDLIKKKIFLYKVGNNGKVKEKKAIPRNMEQKK